MKKYFFVLLFIGSVFGQDVKIVSPYFGSIKNDLVIENKYMNEKYIENASLKGLFFQWVSPANYQWNVFFYNSNNINGSDLYGGHAIFDYYINSDESGRFVAGAGLEILKIDTEDLIVKGITNFKMNNNILAPYLRIGRYFDFKTDNLKYSFFAWAGYERDILAGDLSFKTPAMGPTKPPQDMMIDLDKNYNYALVGAAFEIKYNHFAELQLKYHGKVGLTNEKYKNVVSGMMNIFLSRHWGVSYRFKYMEEVTCNNTYHLGGISFVF